MKNSKTAPVILHTIIINFKCNDIRIRLSYAFYYAFIFRKTINYFSKSALIMLQIVRIIIHKILTLN